MNVNPGGKAPTMRDTIIPDNNPHGKGGQLQSMQFACPLPDNHPFKSYEGQPKGLRFVLQERGLGAGLNGDCQACRQQRSRKPHLSSLSVAELARIDSEAANDSGDEDERPATCCLRQMLSQQRDFLREKSLLEKVY